MILHLRRLRLVPFCAVLPLLSLGCGATVEDKEAKPPAPVQAAKASTDLAIPEWTELLGSTQPLPKKVARLTTAVEAQVSWVLGQKDDGEGFREGQLVKEGDAIVKLDDRVFQANLARGLAGLGKLQNQQRQAALAVDLAKIEVKRLAQLKADKLTVAESEIEKANLAVQDAMLKVRSADEDLKVAQAELAALKAQHAYYTLKAPISGKLGRVEVVTGQTLAIGTRVAEVIDLTKEIDVLCFVPPANIAKVQLRQEAALSQSNGADTSQPHGEVVFKDDQAQPDTGNFAVKVRFPNDKLKLQANAVVRVRVLTQLKQHCDTVPESAVLEDQDPPVVVVVREVEMRENKEKHEKEEIGKAFRIPVKLGIRDRENQRIEIVELVDPEQKKPKTPDQKRKEVQAAVYVVEGAHGLQDKDEIKIEKAEEKEK